MECGVAHEVGQNLTRQPEQAKPQDELHRPVDLAVRAGEQERQCQKQDELRQHEMAHDRDLDCHQERSDQGEGVERPQPAKNVRAGHPSARRRYRRTLGRGAHWQMHPEMLMSGVTEKRPWARTAPMVPRRR